MMNNLKAVITGVLLVASYSASATLYQYTDLSANNGGMSDRLDSVTATFNSDTEAFTWDTTFNSDPTDVDGFWLVVDNGPNPKSSNVNELAIMYGDMATGTLTTYVYNGVNSANSWNTPGIYLQTDTFTVTDDSLSLAIDATAINAWSADPAYTGISFDDNIGIWFHVSTGSNFSYDSQGLITSYGFSQQGWYDLANQSATVVPEPATTALLGLGLFAMGFSRVRRSA